MRGLLLTVALCAFVAAPASAGLTMHVANTSTGNQWGYGVGLEFTVNSTIRVVELGVYDSGANGISGGTTLSTFIFDTATRSQLTSMNFTNANPGTLVDNYLFKPLGTPLVLSPGSYTIVSYGFNSQNPEHNTNIDKVWANGPTFDNGGGLISYVRSVWGDQNGPVGAFPTHYYGPAADHDFFDAPNMIYVPLPASIVLGVFAVGLAGRKLRKFV